MLEIKNPTQTWPLLMNKRSNIIAILSTFTAKKAIAIPLFLVPHTSQPDIHIRAKQ